MSSEYPDDGTIAWKQIDRRKARDDMTDDNEEMKFESRIQETDGAYQSFLSRLRVSIIAASLPFLHCLLSLPPISSWDPASIGAHGGSRNGREQPVFRT
jgi:hypothetical protein